MADEEDVRRLALALPEVTEDGGSYKVRGKGFAWIPSDRPAPKAKRERIEGAYAIRTDGLGDATSLLDAEPDKFFVTPHYAGYPCVLVRLVLVDTAELAELLTDGWRVQAPKRLAAEHGL